MHPAFRGAIALWLVFGVAVAVRTLLQPEQHTVFPVLSLGSQHWWNDQPLYARYRPLDYFRYPPIFAIAITPLSLLGPRCGGVLWSWLNLGIYGWGLWRLRRDVLPVMWTPPREAVFLTLGLLGGLRGLWNGQSNALAIGLLLLAAAAVMRRRWWSAALLFAVPVLIKLTPLVLVLLVVALWPRKLLGRFALLLAGGLLLPFLTKSPTVVVSHYHDWFVHLLGSSGERWPGFRDAWTVWLAARHLLLGEPLILDDPIGQPLPYRAVQVFTGLGVLAWCLWQQRRGVESRSLLALTLALGVAWLMLFGPAIEHATFVFLAPFLAWAGVQRCDSRPVRALSMAALGLILVCGWGALLRFFPAAQPVLLMALPLGTAVFGVWVIGFAATLIPADPDSPLLIGQPVNPSLARGRATRPTLLPSGRPSWQAAAGSSRPE